MKLKELFEAAPIPAVRDLPKIDPQELQDTIDQLKKSDEFKQLLTYAAYATTARKEKNGTLTFFLKNGQGEYHVYANGQIRASGADRLYKLPSPVPVPDLYERYINCFVEILNKIQKKQNKPTSEDRLDINSTGITSLTDLNIDDNKYRIISIGANCKIKDLKGCPIPTSTLLIDSPSLASLEGMPEKIHQVRINNAKIKSLDHISKEISELSLTNCQNLNSLSGVNKHFAKLEKIRINGQQKITNILSLLKIKSLKSAAYEGFKCDRQTRDAFDILDAHLPSHDILSCQDELIESGLSEFAKL